MTQSSLRAIDRDLLVAIRRMGTAAVGDLTDDLGVTATAVRQRIERMIADDLIEREKVPGGRGRPTYSYRLTIAGQQAAGAKTSDLASALWHEVIAIADVSIRELVLVGVAKRMGTLVAAEMHAESTADQRHSPAVQLSAVMSRRDVAIAAGNGPGGLPVLDIESCPYPALTDGDHDRTMCKLEEKMFSTALGRPVHLSSCRLDGDSHCQFTAEEE